MSSLITVLLLVIFLKVCQYIFPFNTIKHTTNKSLKELGQRYFVFVLKHTILILAVATASGFLVLKLINLLLQLRFSNYINEANQGMGLFIGPNPYLLFCVAGFVGLMMSGVVDWFVSKWELKENFNEYLAYCNLLYKCNYLLLLKYGSYVFILITSILLIMSFDSYSYFGSKNIKISPFLSVGVKEYSYSDVKEIDDIKMVKAPSGRIFEDPHYLIKFSDGFVWHSRVYSFLGYEMDSQVINFIKNKTNIIPHELEFEDVVQ